MSLSENEEILKEKMFRNIPSTQAEVLLELLDAVKSKSKWCARQKHNQILSVKAGFGYVSLCKTCYEEIMQHHQGVMLVG